MLVHMDESPVTSPLLEDTQLGVPEVVESEDSGSLRGFDVDSGEWVELELIDGARQTPPPAPMHRVS